ncbi:MAG: PAS domain S-box protein [Deltaproteobacteria bacterium]|nr:PAS domain S-box protein [Deltaproteobacteria bacterium]
MGKSRQDINYDHGQVKLFFLLAILGIIAALNHVHIPHTEVLIEGRWVFGFLGFALLRLWWAALALGALLSYPYGSDISFWVGFGGNMLYAVPSLLVIRPLSYRMQKRWGPDWRLWLGWSALVLACYQAFMTPAVWAVLGLLENRPVWLHILEGWQTQPYLVESILVALFSATALVALLALEQLRDERRRLAHLNRVLLGIRNVNQLIVTEDDPQNLVTRACVNLTETMGYLNAWIALVGGEAGRSLGLPGEKFVSATAAAGFDGGFETVRHQMEKGENPPCMKHALERDEVILTDDPSEHGLDCPLSSGYHPRSGFVRRLTFSGITYGILSVTVQAEYAHDDEARNLFDEVAGDLAFALHKIAMAKRMEESRRRYLEIFEHSRDAFVMVDPAGRIVDANPAFCEMLGYSLDELRALPDFYQITPERWREWESTEIWENRLMGRGYSGTYEKEYRRKDGTVFPVELRSYAVRRGKGEIEYLWGTARDVTEKKRHEAELHISEERFRKLFESLSSGCCLDEIIYENGKAVDYRILDVNPSYERIMGISRSKARNALGSQLYGTGEAPFLSTLAEVADTGEPTRFETFFEPIQRYLEFTVSRPAKGMFSNVFSDISDRKLSEAELLRLMSAVEQTGEVVIITDSDGAIEYVNPTFERVTGYTRNEAIGQNPRILKSGEQDETFYGHLWQTILSGSTWQGQMTNKRKDGSFYVEAASISPVFDNTGQIVNFVAVKRDITEEIRAEKELKESEKKFRMLVDQAADMLLVHDMEGQIIDVNQASVASYGYSREELLSMKVAALDPDYVQRENLGRFWDRFEMNEPFRFEARQKRKDGTIFPVEVTLTKLMINEQLVIMGLCRDISDRKKAEKEKDKIQARLQQAQKMEAIGALAGGIAHDFNNLLFPIVGMSEMLLEDIPPDSPEHENVQEILTAGKRGSALVKQILAFSRQSEGKKIPVRIQQVLKEVIKMVRATIPANIGISHHIDRDCGLVMADPTQVHQIAMNLITNAYHAVDPDNGKISIQLKDVVLESENLAGRDIEAGPYALLTVSDNGCGISPDHLGKIFEPYFTTKEQGKGTGIGLSTVYGIVKEHGGDIQVYSELEKGTTFNIYLPLMVKAPDAVSQKIVESSPSGSERVLLVDDEAAIARLETQMLERLGYQVTFRVSSIEALEAFKASPESYDLVITDMSMPNMTGDRLARELIAVRPDIPVIICTGFSDRMNPDQARAMGIKGFLMKPVVKTELAALVRKVLDD